MMRNSAARPGPLDLTVKPTVNQIESHDGMEPDTTDIASYGRGQSVEPQSYSPRGAGSAELITGNLMTSIDLAHGMTGAQLFTRWMIEHICCFIDCFTTGLNLEFVLSVV